MMAKNVFAGDLFNNQDISNRSPTQTVSNIRNQRRCNHLGIVLSQVKIKSFKTN